MFKNYFSNITNSHILISILFIIALVLGIMSFIPYNKDLNCGGSDCDGAFFSPGAICNLDSNNKKKCFVKKHRYYLIIPSIVLFGIAGLIMYYNTTYNPNNSNQNGEMSDEELLSSVFRK